MFSRPMSRFHTTTIFFILIALGVGLGLQGVLRWVALGVLLTAYLVLFVLGVTKLNFNFFVKAICRGEIRTRRIALTFDDGPDPVVTPMLLEILSRRGVKAAFFPVGVKVKDHPEIIQQIDRQGHIVGNHSYRHAWWTNFLLAGALEREMGKAQGAIEEAIGKVPAYFRPPMGLTNPHLKRGLRKHGLSVVGWDVRPYDTRASTEKVINRVLKKIRNGSIILLHDTGKDPKDLVRQVDALLTEIMARRFTFTGLEELSDINAYQTPHDVPEPQPSIIVQAWHDSAAEGRRGRFRRFLVLLLFSSPYVREAIAAPANLDAFKTRPSRRFLTGVGVILFSYGLGWPMVGILSFLAVYLEVPALLIMGPAFYGFSHLVFMFGVYLAGRDSIRFAHILLRWGLHKAVERILNQGIGKPS
jgi:peptidoglycan/xylan/chitin deacetylase (PgdA/CDA1 family)